MDGRSQRVSVLRRLRTMALLEGTTLVCLVFVAVPMKHLLGLPIAVRIGGPVHGLAFVAYAWSLTTAASGGGLASREVVRLAIGALVPFASFFNERWLKAREADIASGGAD